MTRITGHQVHEDQAQGTVVISTSGTPRLTFAPDGTPQWAATASALTATTGTFAAGAGTAALSGSSWVGNVGTRAYTNSDVVTALKNIGVLPL